MTSERLGQAAHIRDTGGGGLLVSRFLVRDSGGDAEHNTGALIAGGNVPIVWDSLAEDDDIGFYSDYHTTGQFYPLEAGEHDYGIKVSAEIAPVSGYTTGKMVLSIESGGSTVNSYDSTTLANDANPQCSVSTDLKLIGGVSSFEVHVSTPGGDDDSGVSKAVVTITKLN